MHLPIADIIGPFAIGEHGPSSISKLGNPAAAIPKYDFG